MGTVEISADTAAARRSRVRDVSEYVRDEPLAAVAIATAAGFVLGGGVNRRIGLAILTMAGRMAFRGAATSLILGMVTGSCSNGRQDSASPGGWKS